MLVLGQVLERGGSVLVFTLELMLWLPLVFTFILVLMLGFVLVLMVTVSVFDRVSACVITIVSVNVRISASISTRVHAGFSPNNVTVACHSVPLCHCVMKIAQVTCLMLPLNLLETWAYLSLYLLFYPLSFY